MEINEFLVFDSLFFILALILVFVEPNFIFFRLVIFLNHKLKHCLRRDGAIKDVEVVLLDFFILKKNLTGLIVDYDYSAIKQIDYIEDILVSLGALLLQHENILIFLGYNVVKDKHRNKRDAYIGTSPLCF